MSKLSSIQSAIQFTPLLGTQEGWATVPPAQVEPRTDAFFKAQLSELRLSPRTALRSLRADNKHLLSRLEECDVCVVDRMRQPQLRALAEERAVTCAKTFNTPTLVVADFGTGSWFQTLVLFQKLFDTKQWKSIEAHAIDCGFKKLSASTVGRIEQVLQWFEMQNLSLSLCVYTSTYAYQAHCERTSSHWPQVTLAFDYAVVTSRHEALRDLTWHALTLHASGTWIVELRSLYDVPTLTVHRKKDRAMSVLEANAELCKGYNSRRVKDHFNSTDVRCERVTEWPCRDGSCAIL